MRSGRVRLALAVLCAAGLVRAAPPATPDVFVAYPAPGQQVAHDHVILEGSVTPGASLTVNGRGVKVGPDGLFMEWWPLNPGANDLRLIARAAGKSGAATVRVVRTVTRALPALPTAIQREGLLPGEGREWWDPAGDSPAERRVDLGFQGSPGGRATYRIGAGSPLTMREGPAGTYRAVAVVSPADALQNAAVTFSLTGRDGKTVGAVAPGRLSVGGGPRVATQKMGSVPGQALNPSSVRVTTLDGAPLLYPRDGMAFTLVGRVGEDVRARLAPGVGALITAEQLTMLPGSVTPGSVAPVAGGVITLNGVAPTGSGGSASVPADPGAVATLPAEPPASSPAGSAPQGELRVRLPLDGARLPFGLVQEQEGRRLTLTLYGPLAQPLDVPASSDPLLESVEVRPVGLGITRVVLNLTAAQAWGFRAGYDGPDLLLTVRRPPALNPARPLEGRTITLDPGHGGTQNGGAGSLRVPEKNLVLPIALRTAELLRAQGATVNLTRTGDVTLGLYERGQSAENSRSDLLVSIHANALPDGRDPRGIRGPEVYFTHPQAAALAGTILGQLRARLPELGPGAGLKAGADLALTRPSGQISVLVETAYLTDAGNLRTLHSAAGRERFAAAIAAGIADFYAAQAAGQVGAALREP
ncbi:N-acetylmuramoyl-L-alanine amidase [Deinococcus aerophilus]|uniref:N-acetylmuramoyl-L-alanine amidase n=1 Tax=Deinococcus aerophilus TaxID=522488 RepID=A0ABQ2GSA5_9DEIO|nr:N-acetylmuramoyl-L-alanine amidase [Deinococcus aerophilus]GGM09398.1 N-acetylmuramoyl-L-alanine amidase [Deinococcus aerophilus]